jgi:phosphatidylinositol phospholipase C, delta
MYYTPASAHSSSHNSRAVSPHPGSVQSSPAISGVSYYNTNQRTASPGPFDLPDPLNAPPISSSLGRESAPGLIRRVSQSARGQAAQVKDALRRKTSSSNYRRRDDSTGPVARRRSDSKTMTVGNGSLDSGSFEYLQSDASAGLGLFETMSITAEPVAISDHTPEGQAPAVPESLIAGSTLVKVTQHKRPVDKTFFLDSSGSRVNWKGSFSMKAFHVDNIKSIRKWAEAANYQQELRGDAVNPDLCFTVNYTTSDSSKRVKSLHLMAKSHEEVDLWIDTLEALAKHREQLMSSMMGTMEREGLIKQHWDSELRQRLHKSDSAKWDRLDLPAVQSLCERLHIHCHAKDLENAFENADTSKKGSLDYEQFKHFVRTLRVRKDIHRVFQMFSEHSPYITRARFVHFLTYHQGVNLDDEAVNEIWSIKIQELIDMSRNVEDDSILTDRIDYPAFASFVASNDCHVYKAPISTPPKFDMPFSSYFVSSSHNTYLTGRQVAGTSSAETYVTALRHGCRCVEIDCWDGPDGNPRVTHGHTGTSSIPFVDCIRAINNSAFDVSPYPIVVSLEVHCNPEQQRKMVDTMKAVFQHKMLVDLLPDRTTELPSPEELKYKILIKVKATEAFADLGNKDESLSARQRSASSPYRKGIPPPSMSSIPPMPTLPSPAMTAASDFGIHSPTDRSTVATSASSAGEESDAPLASPDPSDTPSKTRKTSKIIPYLSQLGAYIQGYTLRSANDLHFRQFNHIFSINENTAMGLCRPPETKALFEDHNVNHMCRVYPKTLRVASSNFDPNTFWRRGVQFVALNWQTFDPHMQMHRAMFAAGTDEYGYVLKPEPLRNLRSKDGPFETRRKLPRFEVQFSVGVISAQQLPRPQNLGKNEPMNPFVEVQMFSAEDRARGIAQGTGGSASLVSNDYHGIGSPLRLRTEIVPGNGYNPQFHLDLNFNLQTKYPELVFVRFIVHNSPDGKPYGKNCKQIAVFTAKLSALQKGYRHLPLYNGNGEEFIFSTLFCHIARSEPKLISTSLQDSQDRSARQAFFKPLTSIARGLSGDRTRERSSSIEHQLEEAKEFQERTSRK